MTCRAPDQYSRTAGKEPPAYRARRNLRPLLYLLNIICLIPQSPCMTLNAWHRLRMLTNAGCETHLRAASSCRRSREVHFEHWKQNPHTSVATVIIFHWRFADDGGGINRVAPVRDRGQMENRVVFNRGVKSGRIAKGPSGCISPGCT